MRRLSTLALILALSAVAGAQPTLDGARVALEEAEAEGAKARMIAWKEELKTTPDAPPPGPAGNLDVIQ